MAGGAQYIGDEWVYLSADGRSMYGIPEPIRIWSWHLDSLPRYRRLVRRTDRARMRLLSLVVGGMGRATANGGRHRSAATRTINRMAPLLRKQMGVDVSPHRLFGADSCLPSGTDFMILPGPILGRPAVACLQTYIEGEKRDALRGLSDNELVTALGASNGLRRQILAFAEQTRRTYRSQGRCADFLGENNLMLVRNGDRWSLHSIDYGVFDTDRMRRTPALSERIEGCIARIESLA